MHGLKNLKKNSDAQNAGSRFQRALSEANVTIAMQYYRGKPLTDLLEGSFLLPRFFFKLSGRAFSHFRKVHYCDH